MLKGIFLIYKTIYIPKQLPCAAQPVNKCSNNKDKFPKIPFAMELSLLLAFFALNNLKGAISREKYFLGRSPKNSTTNIFENFLIA
jgi:hypothetical protein